jgi:predicted permease
LVCFALICFWSGVFFKKVRKQTWWSAALLGAFFGAMSLLGGKSDKAESVVPKEEAAKPAVMKGGK